MKFVGKWMTLEEIIKYLYPKRQIQHVLFHKWMLTLNLWICVSKSVYPQKPGN